MRIIAAGSIAAAGALPIFRRDRDGFRFSPFRRDYSAGLIREHIRFPGLFPCLFPCFCCFLCKFKPGTLPNYRRRSLTGEPPYIPKIRKRHIRYGYKGYRGAPLLAFLLVLCIILSKKVNYGDGSFMSDSKKILDFAIVFQNSEKKKKDHSRTYR